MSTPTLSAYISAFNLVANGFDYEIALHRALAFFDEVVVAVNTSTDDTLACLQYVATIEPRFKVVSTDLAYTDVTFDGRVKDAALQACTGDVLVQLDLDEYPPPGQRDLWRRVATQLLASPVDCFMIPTVDLWGSVDTIRADAPIGVKFRMHKRGLHRGVWREAWLSYGKRFDTSRSDSCELLQPDGSLARALHIVPTQFLGAATHRMLNGHPFTVHTGYADLNQRVRVNKAIWADHWTLRNGGHDARVAVDTDTLRGYPLIKHHLDLS